MRVGVAAKYVMCMQSMCREDECCGVLMGGPLPYSIC